MEEVLLNRKEFERTLEKLDKRIEISRENIENLEKDENKLGTRIIEKLFDKVVKGEVKDVVHARPYFFGYTVREACIIKDCQPAKRILVNKRWVKLEFSDDPREDWAAFKNKELASPLFRLLCKIAEKNELSEKQKRQIQDNKNLAVLDESLNKQKG